LQHEAAGERTAPGLQQVGVVDMPVGELAPGGEIREAPADGELPQYGL